MKTYTVQITDEEEKALLTDIGFLQVWLDNAIHNKARQMIDKVCEEALNDQSDIILNKEEKQLIVAELAKSGKVISTVKQMPEVVKRLIVSKARVKTAIERAKEVMPSIKEVP